MDSVDDKRFSPKSFRMSVLLVPVTFSTLVGCMDGPFFELKKLNPIIQNQWKEDRKRGDVFSQRVKEFGLVRSQIKKMSDAEQANLVSVINSVVQKETSSEIRREAVLALSEVIHRPDASATLIQLAQDKEEKVRLAVARSLRNHATPETTQTLFALASADSSPSVREIATESLGMHKTDEVKQFLSKQLNDRSPAMQYSASLALKDFTGKDFKGDIPLLKRYMEGEPVEPTAPSLAESIQSYVPFLR
jgi:hypothetical protein